MRPVIPERLPVVITVPVAFGSVHVLSVAVRSAIVRTPKKVAPEAPLSGLISKTSEFAPFVEK